MTYKVFLVEDEIVTREGIRDNVDWNAAGFDFCGEAQDGEVALPLIEKTQPDVLITDIKMPFMDGLQLCKIVRTQMPWIKIIVLSGHDEFEFAQEAIKLGVTEYLLKPIRATELQAVLQNLGAVLDQEREERANLKELQNQVKDVLALKQERLLLDLVVGGISSSEAIEQYGRIGLDMIAQNYLVILVKTRFVAKNGQVDPAKHLRIQEIVTELTDMHPGAFYAQKSMEESLLIMMGDDPEQLTEDGRFLAGLIKADIEEQIGGQAQFGVGSIQQRLTNIHLSFVDALLDLDNDGRQGAAGPGYATADLSEITKLDRAAVEGYLRTGLISDFDEFYRQALQPISEAALHSTLIKHYLFVDIILASAELVTELGGQERKVIPEMNDIEGLLANMQSVDQIRAALRDLMANVLAYRNEQAQHEKAQLIYQAKVYIEANFSDPDLLLEDVATSVHLSPSHFSLVFSRGAGESFKSYLTKIRIERAKELLRTTDLKCFEIAYQCGYHDPHYFSYAFKRNTGTPPQQYRQLTAS
ncbi:MAG: response regulator [Chloroflexota bacterium]|jgi:two-component system response regulator YesN